MGDMKMKNMYYEWENLKVGERIKKYGLKGTIISNVGVGYVVNFDNGYTCRIQDGLLQKIKQ